MKDITEISKFLMGSVQLHHSGVRPGDIVDIYPMNGSKLTLSMTRPCHKFISAPVPKVIKQGSDCIMPSIDQEDYCLSLDLVRIQDSDEDARYIVRSIGDIPFKIHGVFTNWAYINRGAIIDFGYNRLIFSKKVADDFDCEEDIPDKVVKSQMNIMLEGETGTGKTRLAHLIHQRSECRGEFIHLNLTASSSGLLEADLFGHIKGAFTGANRSRRGAFEMANKGTLFLDEIDSIPIDIQTKLLLALESTSVRPLGSEFTKPINTRIIFATGSSLTDLVKQGKLREDFYYRINRSFHKFVAPLRERPDLLEKIMNKFMNERNLSYSNTLLEYYKSLSWDGNIRQFLGHLERKTIIAEGNYIDFDYSDESLSSNISTHKVHTGEIIPLRELKRRYTHNVFLRCGENIDRTADLLGISVATLKKVIMAREKTA